MKQDFVTAVKVKQRNIAAQSECQKETKEIAAFLMSVR